MVLREAHEGDLLFLQRITQTPGWLANIGPRGTETLDGTRAYLERSFLTPYRTHGFGLWVIEVDGSPVGLSGIVVRPGAEFPDLGYALLPEFEGRGFATRAGQVVIDWVRQTQSWTHVDGYTAVGNSASDRVLKRLGFSDMGIVHPEVFNGEESRLWRLKLAAQT
jgi:RimJ/RimL family protein N-acetyltransferase